MGAACCGTYPERKEVAGAKDQNGRPCIFAVRTRDRSRWSVKMANKINTVPALKPQTEKPAITNESENPGSAEHKKVERDADRAAHKAAETERKYDEDHTIFSN
jgi:hypothetical protein